MNHIAVSIAASALMIGAGAGSFTKTDAPSPVSDVMNPMIAGQAMSAGDTIADNAARSPEHTAFVAALKETGLDAMLNRQGTYTVFAPTDAAFSTPQAKAVLKDKAKLAKVLGYQIVRGRYDSQTLLKVIGENGGIARLKTLEGGTLTAMLNGPTNIVLVDGQGRIADISIYDIYQSNGVLQVTDRLALPK